MECRDSQDELWDRITRDDYMKYAVEECYLCMKTILISILDKEGRMWLASFYCKYHMFTLAAFLFLQILFTLVCVN